MLLSLPVLLFLQTTIVVPYALAQETSSSPPSETNNVLVGVTSSGGDCTCEVPSTATTGTPTTLPASAPIMSIAASSSSNIVINRQVCDPNDAETCHANCHNLHGSTNSYLSDKCCVYTGQSASLLAFEEDSKWVPRLEEFNRCTGATVRLEYLPEGEDGMAEALRQDLGEDVFHETDESRGFESSAHGQGIFDAYIVQAPWILDVVSGLENLSPLIKENADTVKFLDINPASRSAVSYNGTVRALPLDSDYIALGWRQDVFHKYNIPDELSPPRTIQDLAMVAEQLNGLDFNNDGQGDWGICLTPQVNYFYAFVAPMMQTALLDPITGQPTGQNMFFSSDTFEPFLRRPAFKMALELYWMIIRNSNCQEQLRNGEKCDRKTAFPTGRCAMVISMPGTLTNMLLDGGKYAPKQRINETTGQVEWDINNEPLGTDGTYWGRRAAFPGSTLVQNWSKEDAGYPLVDCNEDRDMYCPHADESGINYAPFFAEGGEAYALNGRQAKPMAKRVMWDLFTWMSELPVTELPLSGQYRTSHLNEEHRIDLTERAGWPQQMVDDLFNVLGSYFKSVDEGGNPVQDLLMLGFTDYMRALDEELHDKFLGVARESTGGLLDRTDPTKSIHPIQDRDIFDEAFYQFVESLESRYNAISDSISGGQMGQLQRWRQSLNLPWRTEEELCIAALSSRKIDAFQRLQCPTVVEFASLCQTQAEDVSHYDDSICGTIYGKEDTYNWLILIPSVVVPVIILAGIFAYVYVESKKRRLASLWSIKQNELKFNDPPTVVGHGSFGVVLLAEYRGTQVAVKRVIPEELDTGSVGSMNQQRKDSKSSVSNLESLSDDNDDSEQAPTSTAESVNSAVSYTSARRPKSKILTSTFGLRRNDRDVLKTTFLKEMRYLSKLRHPCVTTLMGAVVEKGVEPQLVMEYCHHGSLYDMIHNETVPMYGDVLLPILQDICQGLRFLHCANPQVIHGDLKAANVLVDSRFRAKVADFGLSAKRGVSPLLSTGSVATGTLPWMAPELLRSETGNTAASDVYSFGILLHEVYSRKDPYEGENFSQILPHIVDPKVNKRPIIPTTCPMVMSTLMKECVDADPKTRPTFEELDLRLRRLDPDALYTSDSQYSAQQRQSRNGKAEMLLKNVFPPHIAEALREGRKCEQEHHESVTIFFSDIVGFTTIAAEIGPQKVADMLDRVYNQFDALTDKHDIYKVETVGDAYMAIGNLVKKQERDHAKRIAEFSIDAIKACQQTLIDPDDPTKGYVRIRVGFHSGPVLSGVVGTRLPKYGVFGDTVNTASRMESNSKPDAIHCSQAAAELLGKQAPNMKLVSRGEIKIKGKESMSTYWLETSESPDIENGLPTVV